MFGICQSNLLRANLPWHASRLEKTYPYTTSVILPDIFLQDSAFDKISAFYDVHYLLEWIRIPAGCDKIILLAHARIGEVFQGEVFGAASTSKAIVSMHLLESKELLAKEIGHEAGHLLGLPHCKNLCLMQRSLTVQEISKKSDSLCIDCRSKLAMRC